MNPSENPFEEKQLSEKRPLEKRPERAIARKVWIREILEGDLRVREGLVANSLVTARGDVGRVNVLGIAVTVEDGVIGTALLDDGTGQITVRSFNQPLDVRSGALVQVIARPRTYQGTKYLACEAIKEVAVGWIAYRKRELGEPLQREKTVPIESEDSTQTNVDRMLALIQKLDRGDGALVDELLATSDIPRAEELLEKLLMSGDIFEIRAGRVKVL
jgi:RPA family protein